MAFFGDGDDDDTRSDTPELPPNLAPLKSSKTTSLTCPSSCTCYCTPPLVFHHAIVHSVQCVCTSPTKKIDHTKHRNVYTLMRCPLRRPCSTFFLDSAFLPCALIPLHTVRLPLKRKAVELNSATAGGALKVRPMWLTVSPIERYLLLEDTATGDVLLPLIYMKVCIHSNPTRLFPHPLD